MVNSTANVLAGKPLATGGVLRGPLGTALPTDATTAPAVGFLAAGYIGEDGVTETNGKTVENIKAWGGDVVKVVQTEHTVTYAFTFLETLNKTVLGAVYGDDNVTTTAATPTSGTLQSIKVTGATLPPEEYIVEVKDGDARVRIVIPNGQITEVGDVVYSDAAVIGYPVTISALPDETGVKAYKYLDDGKFSA